MHGKLRYLFAIRTVQLERGHCYFQHGSNVCIPPIEASAQALIATPSVLSNNLLFIPFFFMDLKPSGTWSTY